MSIPQDNTKEELLKYVIDQQAADYITELQETIFKLTAELHECKELEKKDQDDFK